LFDQVEKYGTVEEFITSFEHLDFRMEGMTDAFFQNDLSVASRMKYEPRSSWLTPRLGWKKLNVPRRHNMSSFS
jgi:hypothetical protein